MILFVVFSYLITKSLSEDLPYEIDEEGTYTSSIDVENNEEITFEINPRKSPIDIEFESISIPYQGEEIEVQFLFVESKVDICETTRCEYSDDEIKVICSDIISDSVDQFTCSTNEITNYNWRIAMTVSRNNEPTENVTSILDFNVEIKRYLVRGYARLMGWTILWTFVALTFFFCTVCVLICCTQHCFALFAPFFFSGFGILSILTEKNVTDVNDDEWERYRMSKMGYYYGEDQRYYAAFDPTAARSLYLKNPESSPKKEDEEASSKSSSSSSSSNMSSSEEDETTKKHDTESDEEKSSNNSSGVDEFATTSSDENEGGDTSSPSSDYSPSSSSDEAEKGQGEQQREKEKEVDLKPISFEEFKPFVGREEFGVKFESFVSQSIRKLVTAKKQKDPIPVYHDSSDEDTDSESDEEEEKIKKVEEESENLLTDKQVKIVVGIIMCIMGPLFGFLIIHLLFLAIEVGYVGLSGFLAVAMMIVIYGIISCVFWCPFLC